MMFSDNYGAMPEVVFRQTAAVGWIPPTERMADLQRRVALMRPGLALIRGLL